MTVPRLAAHAVTRTFATPAGEVSAVAGVDLEVAPGELLVVRGRSGSGKTTLLNLLAGLDRPSSGRVELDGVDVAGMDAGQRRTMRHRVGYVLQSFGLIDVLSAAENVEVPLRLQRVEAKERARRVAAALDAVGLAGHGHQRPAELSGGQRQRVGIARALVAEPAVLLADEPTGQLDSGTAATVMDLLHELARERDVAMVVTTHDPLLVARADRVVTLHDGRVSVEPSRGPS